jgi:DNA-directed RNA polymerase subunit beta'
MVEFLDKLKKLGFDFVTCSGISISPFELGLEMVSKEKELAQVSKELQQIDNYYSQGFYSEHEVKEKKIAAWEECKNRLQEQLINNLKKRDNASFYYI